MKSSIFNFSVPHRVLSSPLQHPDRIVPLASFASKCLDNKPYYWGLHRAQDGNANTLYHSDTARDVENSFSFGEKKTIFDSSYRLGVNIYLRSWEHLRLAHTQV